jgi:hypothetical protein
MVNRKVRLILDAVLGLYSLVPCAVLVALYSFVIRARLELGRWPTPMQPDPKNLSFPAADTHMETVFWLGAASVVCFIPWLLTVFIRKQVVPDTRASRLALLIGPWALLLAMLVLDPGRYVVWFLD